MGLDLHEPRPVLAWCDGGRGSGLVAPLGPIVKCVLLPGLPVWGAPNLKGNLPRADVPLHALWSLPYAPH